jgi:alpha-tubulin suppressor-like RCC1 family protein
MAGTERRAALALATVASTVAGLLFACNAIVGVEDVRLRRDSGAELDEGLPDEDGASPDTGPPRENVFEVALGETHTCARKTDGTVRCWGDNTKSQVGSTSPGDGGLFTTPEDVAISDAAHIAAGKNHTCVIRGAGAVSCWGDDLFGQLGDGQTNTRSAAPVDVVGLTDAIAIAGGASFTCAVRASGRAACWGDNLSGQLGNGTKTPSTAPSPVSNLTGVVAISAGEVHACAVTSAGKVACWGNGFNGQLGTGSSGESLTPVTVSSLDGMVSVAAAARTTCALKGTGAVYCWGANEVGQLGTGAANPTPNPTPTVVSGVDAAEIWAGVDHACALKKDGSVVCWGAGTRGQLGDGKPRVDASAAQPVPVSVSGITDAIGIGTGGRHACAPTRTNAIRCWGANDRGQLGSQSTSDELSPVSVVGYP